MAEWANFTLIGAKFVYRLEFPVTWARTANGPNILVCCACMIQIYFTNWDTD